MSINYAKEIQKFCNMRLNELYPSNQNAKKMMQDELAVVEKYNKFPLFYHAKELFEKSHQAGFPIRNQTIEGSFVAFLCGLTDIDPIAENVLPELLFMSEYALSNLRFWIDVAVEFFDDANKYLIEHFNIRYNQCFAANMNKYSCWVNEDEVKMFEIYESESLNHLHKLELATKANIDSIPFDDKATFDMLRTLKDDRNWEYLFNLINPKNFDEFVSLQGLAENLMMPSGKKMIKLIKRNKISLSDVLVSCDDIYFYLLKHNIDSRTAEEIAFIPSRPTFKKTKEHVEKMKKVNIPPLKIQILKMYDFYMPKGYLITKCHYNFKLMWYKAHYPAEFAEIVREKTRI